MPHEVESGRVDEQVNGYLVYDYSGLHGAEQHFAVGEGYEGKADKGKDPLGFHPDEEQQAEEDFYIADAVGVEGYEEAWEIRFFEGGNDPGDGTAVVGAETVVALGVLKLAEPCEEHEQAEEEP